MSRPGTSNPDQGGQIAASSMDYVSVFVGDQQFGIPILKIQDVFAASQMTRIPLAPGEIVGLLNLRGKVVTVLSLRERLGVGPGTKPDHMAIGIDRQSESFALLVERVGEVVRLTPETFEANPVHLDPRWAGLACGVHRLEGRLLVILDVDAVLDFEVKAAA